MLRYLIRRILYAIPILVGVSLFTFLLFYATSSPEQMARRNISAKNPSKEQIQSWLVQHGYDKPRSEQFKKHMTELLLLRFGNSDATGEPIWNKIRSGIGPSTLVGSMIFFSSLFVSITLALLVAYYRGTYLDAWGVFFCVLLMSITYIVYIIAGQYLFGKVLKYLPLAGFTEWPQAIKFALLPMIIGLIAALGSETRFFRTAFLEEINQDYVRTARAKGVSEQIVLFKHVLKNAATPIVTQTVLSLPLIMLGGILTESFFGIPGLGSMTVDAINSQDFAVVRTMVFIGAILYIIGAALTDICYALVDPRVRLE